MTDPRGPLEHVVQIGALLDTLRVPWVLGGSLASSLVGEPRSTLDIDLAVVLSASEGLVLADAVRADYYVDDAMVVEAVSRGSSFNLVHYRTGMKIDVFSLTDDPLDQRQIQRRIEVDIGVGRVWIGAPDDQILRKLRWYRLGGEVSERQWRDVVSILRVQGDRLDKGDLVSAAVELGLGDLAARACAEVDEEPPPGD